MSKIASIQAQEILDSRGNPTVRVHLSLDDGARFQLRFLQALPPANMSRRAA